MADLKTCPECRSTDVDREAQRCPHCRHVFRGSGVHRQQRFTALVICVVLGLFIARCSIQQSRADAPPPHRCVVAAGCR